MSFGVGIEANDKYVIEPQILNKNQFFTNSKEINVIDGFIKIKSKCEFDCYNYWSRINAIEISKGFIYLLKLKTKKLKYKLTNKHKV